MKAERTKRHTTGSVRYDMRRKTWNYRWYDGPVRRSKRLGTRQELPTKAAAWKAFDGLELQQATKVEAGVKGETMDSIIANTRPNGCPKGT